MDRSPRPGASSGAVEGRHAVSTDWPFRGTEVVEERGGREEEKKEHWERK